MGTDGDGYRILFILHLLAVVAAFGPYFVYPALLRAGATQSVAKLHLYLALPAMVAVMILGAGLVGMSDDQWEMSETWISIAFVLWAIAVAVGWFMVRPALSDGSPAVKGKLSAGTGITHVVLVLALVVMVFKPW